MKKVKKIKAKDESVKKPVSPIAALMDQKAQLSQSIVSMKTDLQSSPRANRKIILNKMNFAHNQLSQVNTALSS